MIKPYTAVGLIPTVRGFRRRSDIKLNLEHLTHLVKAAAWLSSLSIPVRLIAFPEGALQAFNDEVLDLDHVTFARECAIDIPGEETEALGQIARQYDAYIMAQAKARHPDLKDRFFNVGFILDPRGEVILKHYKVSPLFPVEHSVCPHDVYDWWVQKYGRTLDAFWPVVDTEIGRMGIMMANEGSYPENARALALNGAEVVYRASYPHPATGNELLRDPEPGAGARQQHVHRRPQHGDLLPVPRGAHAHRHLRGAVVHHRLQGADRRAPGLRGRARRTSRAWWTSRPCASTGRPRSGTTGSRTYAPSSTRCSTSSRSTRRTSTWTGRR